MAKTRRTGTAELVSEIEKTNKDLREAWELPVAEAESKTYNTVRLVNTIGARVKMDGPVSGEHYEWSKAGAVIEVDERDAPALLEKRLGNKVCCGSANQNRIFEIFEG